MKKEQAVKILQYLDTHEAINTTEAQGLLNVSEATVRRIFNLIAQSGSAVRFHGGLKAASTNANIAIPFLLRKQWQSQEKEQLARKALEFLKPDSVSFVHSGSTTLFLGKFISAGTFITDSVTLAELLNQRFPGKPGPEVILTGGTLDRKGNMLTGHKAEQGAAGYQADFMITSVPGLDEHGLIETDDNAVGIQRAMMAHSRTIIVLADHHKFQRRGYCHLAPWEEIDVLITSETAENRDLLDLIRVKGTQVHTV